VSGTHNEEIFFFSYIHLIVPPHSQPSVWGAFQEMTQHDGEDEDNIQRQVKQLRETFNSGKTRSYEYRIGQLRQLRKLWSENSVAICDALSKDLGRSFFESELELLPSIAEIDYCISNLSSWMNPVLVNVPGVQLPAHAEYVYEPLGVCLVIGSFNYPFQLLLSPFMGALIAGNCVVLKPSELSEACDALVQKLLPQYLDPSSYVCISGGVEVSKTLLKQKWDKIFFTGSTRVGKIVLQAAAEHLTPVSLELGGKSPTYFDESVGDVDNACKRILWGKCLNAGQTCIAPDYVLCHEKVYDKFVASMLKTIDTFYEGNPAGSKSFSRIINKMHCERLKGLLDDKPGKILYGGDVDVSKRYVAPTLVVDVDMKSKLMAYEIFGPLLPIIKVPSHTDAIKIIKTMDKPLTMYIFGKNKAVIEQMIGDIQSGSVLVNDTIYQVANNSLPFGGIGPSGMGGYHGKFSFEGFSHRRSIVRRDDHAILDLPARYPPYTKGGLSIIKAAIFYLPDIPSFPKGTFFFLSTGTAAIIVSYCFFFLKLNERN